MHSLVLKLMWIDDSELEKTQTAFSCLEGEGWQMMIKRFGDRPGKGGAIAIIYGRDVVTEVDCVTFIRNGVLNFNEEGYFS